MATVSGQGGERLRKAAEIQTHALLALAHRLGGTALIAEAPAEECDRAITGALPEVAPFVDAQEFLDALVECGCLERRFPALPEPLQARSEYAALWGRGSGVAPHALVHDAALWCQQHWSRDEFVRLIQSVGEHQADYNSLDAVAAMLFWAVAWAATPGGLGDAE